MTKQIDKDLRFVLKHYRHGAFDTRQALQNVKQRTGIHTVRTTTMRYRWIAVAASLLLLVALSTTYIYNKETLLAAGDVTQTFLLPDQTHVTLSPHSTLAYKNRVPRQVTLHGDGYFEVTRNEEHPFTVTNEISQVRVLGTKFMVSTRNDSPAITTEVYVTEGKVGFSAKDNHAQQLVLTRGMKARLTANDDMPRLITAGSINQTAWATGIFHFDNTPLESVLRDLSEYYAVQLYCENTSKRLSGDFHADPSSTNLQEIIHVIEQTLDVKIQIR